MWSYQVMVSYSLRIVEVAESCRAKAMAWRLLWLRIWRNLMHWLAGVICYMLQSLEEIGFFVFSYHVVLCLNFLKYALLLGFASMQLAIFMSQSVILIVLFALSQWWIDECCVNRIFSLHKVKMIVVVAVALLVFFVTVVILRHLERLAPFAEDLSPCT